MSDPIDVEVVTPELDLAEVDPQYVGTQEAVASHLGVDRKSIQRWMKRKDCPGKTKDGYDVKAWRAFTEKAGLGRQKPKLKAKEEPKNENGEHEPGEGVSAAARWGARPGGIDRVSPGDTGRRVNEA